MCRPVKRDFFLCYTPKLSPSKRYILLQQFYPRFSSPELTSGVARLYDLELSPEDNRPDLAGKKEKEWVAGGRFIRKHQQRAAGARQ